MPERPDVESTDMKSVKSSQARHLHKSFQQPLDALSTTLPILGGRPLVDVAFSVLDFVDFVLQSGPIVSARRGERGAQTACACRCSAHLAVLWIDGPCANRMAYLGPQQIR